MEFQEVVRRRKMVRSFVDRPLPADVEERILRNAQRGPSAGFSQGLAFLAIRSPEARALFWKSSFRAGPAWKWPLVYQAPLVLVCLSHKAAYLERYAEADKGWADRAETRWPVPYWDIDTGMAALLVLLTAVDAGLGAVFFGIFQQEEFHLAFGVPDEFTAIGAIAIGYPAEEDASSPSLKRGRRPSTGVVHVDRWEDR